MEALKAAAASGANLQGAHPHAFLITQGVHLLRLVQQSARNSPTYRLDKLKNTEFLPACRLCMLAHLRARAHTQYTFMCAYAFVCTGLGPARPHRKPQPAHAAATGRMVTADRLSNDNEYKDVSGACGFQKP
eukprot:1158817-Pelagomonas_calceolata.AAC.4